MQGYSGKLQLISHYLGQLYTSPPPAKEHGGHSLETFSEAADHSTFLKGRGGPIGLLGPVVSYRGQLSDYMLSLYRAVLAPANVWA